MTEHFYITVAIPYVNARPHIGYAYELVMADVVARAVRHQPDQNVRFLGGTDDYSLKNVLAAEQAGQPTQEFVNEHAKQFEGLKEILHLSFDDFIRTSADERHVPAVERIWCAALDNGDLYKKHYEGLYCIGCELFYQEGELNNGLCPEHGTEPQVVAEENWFFRLSNYTESLRELIASGRMRVEPEPFRNEMLAFLETGLDDISVSRSVARARGWGVPVPNDESQVIYVWFDALVNYISALRFGEHESDDYRTWWQTSADRVHVVGKGITRFHTVYWPAFLLAAGQPLPSEVRVHPYLMVGGSKMSKSAGTVFDPIEIVEAIGVDALRWWFCRDVNPVSDTDFTLDRVIDRANEDLAGGLGNAVNRVITLIHKFNDGRINLSLESDPSGGATFVADVAARAAAFDLRGASRLVSEEVASVNRDLALTKPWELARDEANAAKVDELLTSFHRRLVALSEALFFFTPGLSGRFLEQLVSDDEGRVPEPSPVYPRIELPEG